MILELPDTTTAKVAKELVNLREEGGAVALGRVLTAVRRYSAMPIGIQLAAGPANEHLLLQLATALEEAEPWAGRVPPLHVANVG